MTPEELLFALAPDGKAVAAARQALERGFTGLKRSADGEWLAGSCGGEWRTTARLGGGTFQADCDCPSRKYPCKHAVALAVLALERPGDFAAGGPSEASKQAARAMPEKALPRAAAAPASAGDALLRAVFDEPDDEAAPLIYADWLSEHGTRDQQAHAEFIRVQSRLEKLPEAAPERPALLKEEKALLRKHRPTWMKGVPDGLRRKVYFVGGFVRRVQAPASKLLPDAEALAEACPITEVYLTGNLREQQASRLAVMAWWSRVRLLSLEGCSEVEPRALELLLNSLHLRRLRRLNAGWLEMGARLAALVARWPGLENVEALSLGLNGMTAHGVEVLCASEHLKRLRELQLEGNHFGSAGAAALAGCERLATLRRLVLDGNEIGAAGVKALAQSPHLAGLEGLGLARNPITDAGARAVLEGFPALRSLRLDQAQLKADTRAKLAGRLGEGLQII